MALRPVSELGLTDVTDIAGQNGSRVAVPRIAPARPASRRQGAAPGAHRGRRQPETTPSDASQTPQTAPPKREGGKRAGVGTAVVSSTMTLTGSALLTRAVLQRRRRAAGSRRALKPRGR